MAYTRNPPRVTLTPDPMWAFLDELGLSRNEPARLSGISRGCLSRLMSGSAHPSPEVRESLQRELRIADFDDLLTITG